MNENNQESLKQSINFYENKLEEVESEIHSVNSKIEELEGDLLEEGLGKSASKIITSIFSPPI